MNKFKILFRVFKKILRRAAHGNFKYRGKGPIRTIFLATLYLFRFGPSAFIRKFKHELISFDRRASGLGDSWALPNGLVSGVSSEAITPWYAKHAKPVTIVIPSYNDFEVLASCVDSLKTTTDPEMVSILIVDDYCTSASRQYLKTLEDGQVKVLYRKQNGGFAKAVNSGLEAADKKHDVVLLNSDIIAHQGWLEALQYGAYEFGVDTGIVGPKLLYPDGRIQSAGGHRNTDQPKWFDHYYRFQESNYGPANVPHYCLFMTGACLYIKRELLDYVGGVDTNFEFAFEDVDLCLRGWEAGYRTLYFPSATLTHVESATRAKHKTMSVKEKQSIDYFWNKWGDWFDKRRVTNAAGKRRIIFVLQTFGLSGGIKNIFEQANRLSERNFDIEIWGLDRDRPIWDFSDKIKIRTFKNYDRLTQALSHEDAIKVATWWETAFPVWLASVKRGIPVYMVSEFETWFYPDDIVAQSVVVSCYRKEFRNLTISSSNQEELRAIGLEATLLPCGYDDKIYHPLKNVERQANVMLAVGRSFFQKNFPMTFRGWKLLGDKRPEMWLYGAEPEMARLDRKITYFKKPQNSEVNKLYNQATFFVQTSRHEGFCLPILEAMAAGCPVICTDAHGNRDFSLAGKNCLMVEQDDEQALSEAIKKLQSSHALRQRLAAEGLKTARQFRWDAIMKIAEKFYSEVV
ncbi:glycosyltransferase [Candidatus Saccharibacteria bacterium]|nr:glycosyltransferase [Candidatus Saccharibacteria bacterium]